MARVHVHEAPRGRIEEAQERGHEPPRFDARDQELVESRRDAIGFGHGPRIVLAHERGAEPRHEQRGRDTLARDVGHHEQPAAVPQVEVVVVIAAHLARRIRATGHVVPRDDGRSRRQQARLDATRDLELVLEARPLVLALTRLFETRRHLVEALRRLPQIVLALDRDAVRQTPLAERLRALAQRTDGARDAASHAAHHAQIGVEEGQQQQPQRDERGHGHGLPRILAHLGEQSREDRAQRGVHRERERVRRPTVRREAQPRDRDLPGQPESQQRLTERVASGGDHDPAMAIAQMRDGIGQSQRTRGGTHTREFQRVRRRLGQVERVERVA